MVGRDGFVVIDKPPGITSHDVVARLRRVLGTRRVGHGGTLDPQATGVLIVAVGRATRLLRWVSAGDKCYRAVVRLGSTTTTDDADGEVLATASVEDVARVDDARIGAAIDTFRGTISQRPSSVSAIKAADGNFVSATSNTLTVTPVKATATIALGTMNDGSARRRCASRTPLSAVVRT